MAVQSIPGDVPAAAGRGSLHRLRSLVAPVLTLALFLAAAWAIHRELSAWTFTDIADAVVAPDGRLALAILAAALSYAVLSLYDPLALPTRSYRCHCGEAPWRFVGYAFSHGMGLPLLTGGAVRYRLYSAWGLGPARSRVSWLSTASPCGSASRQCWR